MKRFITQPQYFQLKTTSSRMYLSRPDVHWSINCCESWLYLRKPIVCFPENRCSPDLYLHFILVLTPNCSDVSIRMLDVQTNTQVVYRILCRRAQQHLQWIYYLFLVSKRICRMINNKLVKKADKSFPQIQFVRWQNFVNNLWNIPLFILLL